MPQIKMPYGNTAFTLDLPPDRILAEVNANVVDLPRQSPAQVVRKALESPINSKKLGELVRPGEKICLLVPDITRLWQAPYVTLPIVLEELNSAGIPDEDIFVLCACGTHRRMSEDEHKKLLGDDIVKRLRIIDHQCRETDQLRKLGVTSRGTPVLLNKNAVEADKIISLCGAVYHFMAGFGGGPKMIMPGISGQETIQHSHQLALNPGKGCGANPHVRTGNISESNPFHMDILEGAEMLPPDFAVNVVVDDNFRIIDAFAGEWKESHRRACAMVDRIDSVKIPARSDLVIASAGGAPKDINLYQGVKCVMNALAAARMGATIIIVAQCPEGIGNADCQRVLCELKTMEEREKALRSDFSIGAYVGYVCADASEKYRLIFVTDMDPAQFAGSRFHAVKSLDAAFELAQKLNGGELDMKAIVMPHGGSTFPVPQRQE